ncbi:tRNA (adenosine(37)-N6)-threonylcarbamoyltransferase complex dimerization subunit type 1 TsaB [Aestuariivirga sp.]|uniref:tRNA (adenosine(37)-N6)-threonylcarbamoyltransferase complex dimerization subunit type 1 TsaB n=1 Tax=Aestuariivirga sp. TaxID=2650926 RepID=UPI0025BD26A9|nr:tRNA (adenosine(37)-N6)-threonylcarbamoyltransferase complex dimerization subunit type 1 TsaB [Aestuariivirga sp.]MCA3554359.1 tRNA (adenosine(37)-N6)-threonylcarbamoyltransferase complex dimerization subunit type 1 TsaB [Aestuariivirga sp.]
MKILSLDAAMAACSAAVIDTEVALPLAAALVEMERGHAEALPSMVAEVMACSGLAMSQIDRVAVTTGPGAFTGVRIGLAMARGLGLARGIPVIGIDSLSAIAANETARSHLLVVSDARNDEVYAALFDADRKLIMGPQVAVAAHVAAGLPGKTVVLGTAARSAVAASGRGDLILSQAFPLPVASRFARIYAGAAAGNRPAPLYLRTPDARPQAAGLRKFKAMRIEPAGLAADGLLAALHGESFDDGWNAQTFAEMLSTPGTEAALAHDGGDPLGFIVTRQALDEAEIIAIGVRPAVQRRGVAHQLLAWQLAVLAARGVRHLFLEVAASNLPAQALYTGSGFAEAGRRKGYYKRHGGFEDAIVLRRELHP